MDSASPPLPKRNKRKIPRQATSEVAWEFDPVVVSDSYPLLEFPPYRHKQQRRNSITLDPQRAFVAHLAFTGIVKSAAVHIGRSLEALYKLRARPGAEGFAAAGDEALGWGVARIEDCATERALAEGLSNPRANSMLALIIRHRYAQYIDARYVIPGHWLYESIRAQVLAEMGYSDDRSEVT